MRATKRTKTAQQETEMYARWQHVRWVIIDECSSMPGDAREALIETHREQMLVEAPKNDGR